jgi:hypothetical protein
LNQTEGTAQVLAGIVPIAGKAMDDLFACLDTLVNTEFQHDGSIETLACTMRSAGIRSLDQLNLHKPEKDMLMERFVQKRAAKRPNTKCGTHKKVFYLALKKVFAMLKEPPQPQSRSKRSLLLKWAHELMSKRQLGQGLSCM